MTRRAICLALLATRSEEQRCSLLTQEQRFRDRSFTQPHQPNLTRPGSLTPERMGDRFLLTVTLSQLKVFQRKGLT